MLLSLFNRVLGVPSVKYAYPELLSTPVPASVGSVDVPAPGVDHVSYPGSAWEAGIGAEGTDDMHESFSESIHHEIPPVEFNSFDNDIF